MDGYDSQWQLTVVYISAIAHHIVILVTYSNMFYSYIMEISLGNLVAYIYGLNIDKVLEGKFWTIQRDDKKVDTLRRPPRVPV